MEPNKAPAHLQPDTRRWYESIVADFDLESHHLKLLTLASEAWDRAVQAREILAKEGLTFLDRFQSPRAHPCVSIEQQSRIAFARLLRELALDVASPEPRPPGIS